MPNSVIEKVREKYPQYASVPDDELTDKLAHKYPDYLDRPDFQEDYTRLLNQRMQSDVATRIKDNLTEATKAKTSDYLGAFAEGALTPLTLSPSAVLDVLEKGTEAIGSMVAGKPMVWMWHPSETMRKPISGAEIPQIPIPADTGPAATAAGGLGNAVIDFANFLQTPEGVSYLGIGKLPKPAQRIITADISGQMAAQAPKEFSESLDAFQRGDSAEGSKHAAAGFLAGVMSGATMHEAIKTDLPTITPSRARLLADALDKETSQGAFSSFTRPPPPIMREAGPLRPGDEFKSDLPPVTPERPPISPVTPITPSPDLKALAPQTAAVVARTTELPKVEPKIEEPPLSISSPSVEAPKLDTPAVEEPPAPAAEAEPAAPEPPASTTVPAKGDPIRIPLNELKLSQDVPNFKAGADPKTGTVPGQELKGDFQHMGFPPIVAWERLNGDKEVITGRHRFRRAQETGQPDILSYLYKEADGFTKEMAMIFDAEANIRDGQGDVADFATYFKGAKITEAEARARGLLDRAKGHSGWSLARNASDDLYALWRADKISEAQAVVIADAAPGNPSLQQIGIRQALAGETRANITGAMEAAGRSAPSGQQTDFFADTSLDAEWQRQGRIIAANRKALQDTITGRTALLKRFEQTTATGSVTAERAKVEAEVATAQAELARWANWAEHPDLVAKVRGAPGGVPPGGAPAPSVPPVAEVPSPPKLRPGEKGTGDLLQGGDAPFNLSGEQSIDPARVAAEQAAKEKAAADKAEAEKDQDNLFRKAPRTDPFEQAARGDESAFDHLDEQFRNTWPDPEEQQRRPDPHTVHTPEAFVRLFEKAFAARDFESVVRAIKATSDVSVWKPLLKELFKNQATDPLAAKKAEWFRHVFAGTVPPDAIPPRPPKGAGPTPPPKPGPTPKPGGRPPPGTPPPGAGGPPPGAAYNPPPRIAVAPITGGKAKSPYQIIQDFSAAIGKALRILKLSRGVLGEYRPGSTTTADRFAGDLDTAAHELAGHWTDDKHGLGKPWITPRTRSPYDTELAKFWIHGSVTPSSSLRYRRAEGIAEFIRAYVVNPLAAKREAPTFAAYFERTLPPKALKAINDFGTDVRTWAGEDPLQRGGLLMRMDPPTLTQRLWDGLRGRGFGFEINPIDRLRQAFDDPYHYAVKAFKAAAELAGKKLLPQQDFELLARLLSGHDRLMTRQFENGLEPLRPVQRINAAGKMEVVPHIDPVTNEPMTMKWLMGAFQTDDATLFKKSRQDTSAYMVAQRTLEKSPQLGRQSAISGLGAGIISDVQAAKELLARVAQDPALEARLKEGARRYRLWAGKNLDMLVDAGRLSVAAAKEIRERNEFYVDMHRLSEEFDVANFAQRGGSIGTPKDVIRRFKGSTLQVDDVYSNLLDQTDSIQKEARRNLVMNAFTDTLRHVRSLHGPDLKDFDQFGRKVAQGNLNTIRIFRDGRAEHWQFDKNVHESLKGLGEMQTNALWQLAVLPSRLARYMITHSASFMLRNIGRDTMERAVNSQTGGKPWDILQGYTKEDLARFEVFGGGQFGNFMRDRLTWNREIKRVSAEMVKDNGLLLLNPLRLKHAWEELGAKSETLGRIAEFRRAFDKAQKQLPKDHPTLTIAERDYNAALYAAGQARGLLDFAKAGTVMRHINQAIPFSNATMRGLGKSFSGLRENPGRYAMNWGLYVLTPTLAMMMWNRRDEETWKEYLQLPAYRRDLFWNLKAGDRWLVFPKPHLLGVLAGGAERAIIRMMGEKHAVEGIGTSVSSAAFPVQNLAEATGPLKTFIELNLNRDTFRDRDIVPIWERDLKLELRKGTTHASGAGQGVAAALNTTGLTVDPRQMDHILRAMGGWGTLALNASRKNAIFSDVAVKATGFVADPPGVDARDVQWVIDWAKKNGKLNDDRVKMLMARRTAVYETKTIEDRTAAMKALRQNATYLRATLESSLKK